VKSFIYGLKWANHSKDTVYIVWIFLTVNRQSPGGWWGGGDKRKLTQLKHKSGWAQHIGILYTTGQHHAEVWKFKCTQRNFWRQGSIVLAVFRLKSTLYHVFFIAGGKAWYGRFRQFLAQKYELSRIFSRNAVQRELFARARAFTSLYIKITYLEHTYAFYLDQNYALWALKKIG